MEAVRLEVARAAGPTLRVELHAPEALPALPAAVETALYRIALEAVTNVVHHAGARSCVVRLARAPSRSWLRLAVEDDGCGLAPGATAGVGLRSMQERAEEIGGWLELTARPGGGTRIEAVVPLGWEER